MNHSIPIESDGIFNGVSARESPTALVLGGGGSTGNAWLIGVIAGLYEAGLNVTEPDLTIGTSAGSTAAAALAGSSPKPGNGTWVAGIGGLLLSLESLHVTPGGAADWSFVRGDLIADSRQQVYSGIRTSVRTGSVVPAVDQHERAGRHIRAEPNGSIRLAPKAQRTIISGPAGLQVSGKVAHVREDNKESSCAGPFDIRRIAPAISKSGLMKRRDCLNAGRLSPS